MMKKTIKEIVCLVVVISMILSLFVVPASAHPSSATLVSLVGEAVNLDFNYAEQTVIGSNYDFGNGIKATHSYPADQNVVNPENKYLEIAPTAAGTTSRMTIADDNWQTSDLTKDRYFTEFRFKLDTLTAIDTLFRAEFCAAFDTIDWAASSPYVWAGIVASNEKYYIKASGTTITAVPLEADMWYNVKVDINIKEKKFDFYLNGALFAYDLAFTSTGSAFNKQTGKSFASGDSTDDRLYYWDYLEYAGIEFPNKFNRIFFYQDKNNAADISFDDIRVYKEPTGVITYGADDFSDYSQDVVYNGSKIYQNFAGLALRTDAHRQCNFTIDAENGYAISGTGRSANASAADGMQIRSNLFTSGGAVYAPGNYKENSIVTEFTITPKTATIGTLSFYDNLAKQYGIDLQLNNNNFIVTHGLTGDITASKFKVNTSVGTYEVDKTYKIKICIDLNRTFDQVVTDRDNLKRTLPGICDVYIDDELVLCNAAFAYQATSGGDEAVQGLGNVLLRTNDECQAYFDDFRMYSDEKEEVLSVVSGYMMDTFANGVISSDSISLPATYTVPSGNTFNICWSEAKGIINTETGAVDKSKGGNVTLTAKIFYEGEEDYNLTYGYDMYVVPDLSTGITPVDYEINSITYKNAAEETVFGPSDGGKLTGVSVKNNTDTAADLYVAVYEEGVLTGCDVAKSFTTGDIPLDISVNSASDIQFFVWSNDGAIKPLASPFKVTNDSARLFILSDSIYDETPPATQPSTGVGLALKSVYNQSQLEIVNLAECGASLKTFAQSGALANALNQMERGDYVLISFCHNDSKWPSEPNSAMALDADGNPSYDEGSYEFYLEEYVQAIRLKGAIPMIATSVPRWEFDGDTPTSTFGNYYNAAVNVSNYINIPLIDVYTAAIDDLTEIGAEASKAYYVEPVDANGDGVYDKTHMTEAGAAWVADIISELAADLALPFSAYNTAE